jgi:hypothetical protein
MEEEYESSSINHSRRNSHYPHRYVSSISLAIRDLVVSSFPFELEITLLLDKLWQTTICISSNRNLEGARTRTQISTRTAEKTLHLSLSVSFSIHHCE